MKEVLVNISVMLVVDNPLAQEGIPLEYILRLLSPAEYFL